MAKSSSGNFSNSSNSQFCQWQGEDLLVWINVQPRSSRNAIEDIHDDRLRVRLTVAPTGGKANQALKKLLAKSFGVSVSQVSIEKGETSKAKRVRISRPKFLPEILK